MLAGVRGGVARGTTQGVEPALLEQPAGEEEDGGSAPPMARAAAEKCNAHGGPKTWPTGDRVPARHRAARRRGGRGRGREQGDER